MKLTRNEIDTALKKWNLAWDNHDLDGVMDLFHEKVQFENWTGGRVRGKEPLRKAWAPWFENHGNFRFIEEETFIDENEQKVLYRWQLEWPSIENTRWQQIWQDLMKGENQLAASMNQSLAGILLAGSSALSLFPTCLKI